ncbi:MAG: hypothetical protein BBJ57_12605 [Desulfobacterales bacterium PC51MH44]|nr:MAG: hypothetical protein BBJ57_12605 [Desulfobacterales bacterium PC51MH44]
MPGIAGIVDFRADSIQMDQNIRRMAKILNHTSPSAEEIYILNHAALAAVRIENYPYHNLIAQNEQIALVFWGYLGNHEELGENLDLSPMNREGIPAGDLLLQVYSDAGANGFCDLNGRYVIALWDKKEKSLKLITDRYGFCKLYYWVSSTRILFSSEYKAIIWHKEFPKKIDEQGIADFMALGFSAEDRTFFSHVKLLSPATVATFNTDGDFSVRRYWDYSFHTDDDPVFPEQYYVDKFAEILTIATKRQIDSANQICLPLSGGLDSRTLAGILNKIDYQGKVKTVSYGNPYCYDVVYGKRIAEKIGFDHSYVPIESTYLKDFTERFVWLMEGTVNCLNAHMLLTYPFIEKNNLDIVMTGFLGDTISGSGSFLKGIEGERNDEVIIKIQYDLFADIMKENDLAVYMKQDLYENVRGKTFEAMRSQYYRCPSRSKYFRTRYFNIHERQRRYTSFNLYVFDFVAVATSPFLDRDFVDFILHVPPVLMLDRNLYKKMIIRHLPKVASAPYNKTKLPLNASWIRKGLHWRWESLNRNSLIRATIGRRYAKMNDNYLNSGVAAREGSRQFVIKHIRDNSFLSEYFKMDRVHQLLDEHMSGKKDEYGKVTALLTLSLWHKLFVENEKPTFE